MAERIETEEMLERCRALGFELFQGYHLGRPVPPEDIDALLRQHPTQRASV